MGHFGSFPLYYETSSDETSFSSHVEPVTWLLYAAIFTDVNNIDQRGLLFRGR